MYDWKVETEGNVSLGRWYDRETVNLHANEISPIVPEGKFKRWSAADKKSVEINCPNVVKEYQCKYGWC